MARAWPFVLGPILPFHWGPAERREEGKASDVILHARCLLLVDSLVSL